RVAGHGVRPPRTNAAACWPPRLATRAKPAPPAEDEEAAGGEREEDEVDGDDVAQDRLVGPEERQRDRDRALQRDGDRRHARLRAHPRDGAKEEAVLRHGEVDAGGGEDRLAEEAERRQRDPGGDGGASAPAERADHDLQRRRTGRRESRGSQGTQADEGDEGIERDHPTYAGEERAGQVAARLLHLARDEAGGLPAAVREEDGNERRAEIGEGARRSGQRRRP